MSPPSASISAAASTRTDHGARQSQFRQARSCGPEVPRHKSSPSYADHGARAGLRLHRPGPWHRRPARRALFPRTALRPRRYRLAGARPIPALDRTLLDRALGGAGGGGNSAGVGAADLRRRRQPPCHEHARHDAGRRDHRRFARPRSRPGRRAGARPQTRRLAGAGLRRAIRRRDAGGIDLGGGDVRFPFQARQPRRRRRLQRHPGRRHDRPRHGAGG